MGWGGREREREEGQILLKCKPVPPSLPLSEEGGAIKFSSAHAINCILLKVLILNLKSKDIFLTILALAVHLGKSPGGKFNVIQ